MPNPNLPINYRKNTYIGARYVPKFSDTPGSEWDNSIQYEPLTIVLYQGNSYTSKTFVPVGADINNGNYWVLTGNYNAQFEQLLNQFGNIFSDYENQPNAREPLSSLYNSIELCNKIRRDNANKSIIRIATFNNLNSGIWFPSSFYKQGIMDAQILYWLNTCGANFIGLQECNHWNANGFQNRYISNNWGYGTFQPAGWGSHFPVTGRQYIYGRYLGECALSQFEPINSGGGFLNEPTNPTYEPRAYAFITFAYQGKTISCYTTHFAHENDVSEKIKNLNSILNVMESDPSNYVVCVGDFNTDPTILQENLPFNYKLSNTTLNTFPASNPDRINDNIIYKNINKVSEGVITTTVSDHCLYYADFTF